MNHFEKFGLILSYNIDLALLEKKYFEFQQSLHPDKHVNKSEQERLKVLQDAMEINAAYKILKSDLHRAEYLMNMQDVNYNAENSTLRNMEVLTQAFHDRERLESAESLNELDAMLIEVRDTLEKFKGEFGNLYEKGAFEAAARVTALMRYKSKLLEEIETKISID